MAPVIVVSNNNNAITSRNSSSEINDDEYLIYLRETFLDSLSAQSTSSSAGSSLFDMLFHLRMENEI